MRRALQVAAVCLASAACTQSKYKSVTADNPKHQDILNSARDDYAFPAFTTPVDATVPEGDLENPGVPAADAPTDIKIYRAVWTSPNAKPADSEVLAKIETTNGYKPLHIPAGTSYIWRDVRDPDPSDTKWKTWIVPQEVSDPMHQWKRNAKHEPFSMGDPKEPRLVHTTVKGRPTGDYILAACIDDPVCGGHCGYGSLQ